MLWACIDSLRPGPIADDDAGFGVDADAMVVKKIPRSASHPCCMGVSLPAGDAIEYVTRG
jgi:hypothetical protein